uniref:Uncharacterized protein n=1 Tax=Avena sativa TaxID=4498 RepID=A0ACD5YQP6_AVESA
MDMEMELPSVHAADIVGDGARHRLRDYLLALEEECRKIQVFQRELPLCLDLVTQTIEGMRGQLMDGVFASEETVSDHGPVLEEFIPLKPSLSLCSSDDESAHAVPPAAKKDEAETRPPTPEAKRPIPHWLQSVQLWSQQPQQSSHDKPVALNATKAGGAFHPFEKNKRAEAEAPASSTTAPAASSAVLGDTADKATSDTEMHEKDVKDVEKDKDKEGQSQPNRKPRRCWAPELHRLFLQALQQLGGPHVATPKQIRELMKVDGLTNDEVKSHLQVSVHHESQALVNSTAFLLTSVILFTSHGVDLTILIIVLGFRSTVCTRQGGRAPRDRAVAPPRHSPRRSSSWWAAASGFPSRSMPPRQRQRQQLRDSRR